jgi:hypothetical protein
MTDDELINIAVQMRRAQKAYFRNRDPFSLAEAKKLEKQFDKEIERRNMPEAPRLF